MNEKWEERVFVAIMGAVLLLALYLGVVAAVLITRLTFGG